MTHSDKHKTPVLVFGPLQLILILVRSVNVCMDSYQLTYNFTKEIFCHTQLKKTCKQKPIYSLWVCKVMLPIWKTVWRFPKTFKIELLQDTLITLLGVHRKDRNQDLRDVCTLTYPRHLCAQEISSGNNPNVHQEMNG